MTVESATYINQLDATLPNINDAESEGPAHIKLVKSTVKATFPNVTGVVPVYTAGTFLGVGGTPAYPLDVNQASAQIRLNSTTNTNSALAVFARGGSIDGYIGTPGSNNAVTSGASVGDFVIRSEGHNVLVSVDAGTSIAFAITSDGRVYGTKIHNNAGSVTGTTNQYIASGTYTPTTSSPTNVAASTARQFNWIRVGNVVTADGILEITPSSANAPIGISLTLPIISNVGTATYYLSGIAARDYTGTASLSGTIASSFDGARLSFQNDSITGNFAYRLSFKYEVR